jgi:hypothetical protein
MALFKRNPMKGPTINQGLRQQIRSLESSEIDPEIIQANQEAQMRKNQGLASSALGLFKQQSERGQMGALNQLRNKRSLLGGVGSIAQGNQDAALRLANLEQEARDRNIQMASASAIGLGRDKMGLQKYKQEGLFNYYMGKKQARQAQINSLLNAGVMLGYAAMGIPPKPKTTTTTE